MTPLTEHQLLVFWAQLALLLAVARGLGGLARRIGQPAVVGELAAGLLVGPSVLGRLAPDLYRFLFPSDPVQSGLLLAVAWIGVALLLVVTGFETDLALLAHLGRSSLLVSVGSLLVPLALGFGVGQLLPGQFVGPDGTRLTFSLFMAVALSLSALPVVAKILLDMRLMRRNVGQVIVAAGMANDLVGWILLGAVAGIVTSGGFNLVALATTVGAMAVFMALAFTVGQRLTDAALRRAYQSDAGLVSAFTVAILVALVAAVSTQAIGVEAVLGAFLAGIVLGRSRYQREEVAHALEVVTNAFFAPVFFATAGLFVDLGLLLQPSAAAWAGVVVAVAAVAKLLGSSLGAWLGGMSRTEGLAGGVGLNARGAIEIVVATVGLGLGVLNQTSYSVVVVLALATSMMAPPLLRAVLRQVQAGPDEAARLQREAVLERSVIADTKTALLPTRGGTNSVLAGRLLDLALHQDTTITIYTVHPARDDEARQKADIAAREVERSFGDRPTDRIDRVADDVAEAICTEARLGYGLVALGMTEAMRGGQIMSPLLHELLSCCSIPLLLVKHGAALDPHAPRLGFRRILVPAVGTRVGQAAQEVAYTIADGLDASVDVVHVVNRPDKAPSMVTLESAVTDSHGKAVSMLEQARSLAAKFGQDVNVLARVGPSVGEELAAAGKEIGADLLVLGARMRSAGDKPFMGHGVEYVLEHAEQTVLVILFPVEEPAVGGS
ncbi:MAG: cation:proton antiporter [Actinomycetota bacterium]|nr:cation:proton antiporter [Actinomycetota bacterium]